MIIASLLIAVPMFCFLGAAIFEILHHRGPTHRELSALAPRHHRDPSHARAKPRPLLLTARLSSPNATDH